MKYYPDLQIGEIIGFQKEEDPDIHNLVDKMINNEIGMTLKKEAKDNVRAKEE